MIERRRLQLQFRRRPDRRRSEGFAREVDERMPIGCWTTKPDRQLVYEALGQATSEEPQPRPSGAPAEVVLRLFVLKHVRNWSYEVLEREVRANLVYRDFTRVGGGKMPDAKTIGRWGLAVGPQAVKQVHERLVAMAKDRRDCDRRRMRVDTTVVETNIHYPTNSSLLGDGVRVLTRAMKKITAIAGDVGAKLRDRSRSVKLRVLDIARAARAKGPQSQERLKAATAGCWLRPAGWSARRTALPRSPRASNRRAASWSNSPWKACVAKSRRWCRGYGK